METKLQGIGQAAIDLLIDMFSIRWVISWLIEQGDFTKEELLELKFDEEDIDYVLEGNYDGE